eukprot:5040141-Prymnesium_polylepis.2
MAPSPAHRTQDQAGEPDEVSEYEQRRLATMGENAEVLALIDKRKIGQSVAIPNSVFPDEPEPAGGCWMGKIVKTSLGGTADVGILIVGEPVFTRPRTEVVNWVVEQA